MPSTYTVFVAGAARCYVMGVLIASHLFEELARCGWTRPLIEHDDVAAWAVNEDKFTVAHRRFALKSCGTTLDTDGQQQSLDR